MIIVRGVMVPRIVKPSINKVVKQPFVGYDAVVMYLQSPRQVFISSGNAFFEILIVVPYLRCTMINLLAACIDLIFECSKPSFEFGLKLQFP